MVTTLDKPSSLIHEIQFEKVDNWNLFKFSNSLQSQMEILLQKKKDDELTPDEITQLEAIAELDRVFTHIIAVFSRIRGNKILERFTVQDCNTPHSRDYRYNAMLTIQYVNQ